MPKSSLNVGALNLDMGPSPGNHLWVAKDVLMSSGGYDMTPSWISYANETITTGYLIRGVGSWRGGYVGRLYLATNDKLWELGGSVGDFTDVTGNSLTNTTHGVTFASYGDWAFASNGVNHIQAIRVPSTLAAATNFADMVHTSGGAKFAAKYICSHKNHLVAANLTFLESYGEIASFTTPAGAGFTSLNQPNGDSIQVYGDAADTAGAGKYVTVYGTYTGGGDTVAAEQILINGASAVTSSRVNWEKILGMNSSFEPVLITARKTVGGAIFATFDTITGTGIEAVTAGQTSGGDQLLDIVASDTTTRVIGIIGTSELGVAQWDSQELTGATTVQSNLRFRTFTHILTGNLEASRTVTVSAHAYAVGQEEPYLVWWSGIDDPEGYGTETYAPQIVGSSNQPLLDGVGKITGVVDGGDCFFVFKAGSIYRFDGPPFQSTVISSTFGMAHGNVPYRQNDRIYFWSSAGLRFIDIKSNEVVKASDGFVQKSVTGAGIGVYTGTDGQFPAGGQSTFTTTNGAATGTVASISGDPANSVVFVLYYNGSSGDNAVATWGLVYDEVTDRFTQLSGPTSSNAVGTYLCEMRTDDGTERYTVGSAVKCLYKTSATNMRADSFTRTGFTTSTSSRNAYLRWPMWSAMQDGVDKASRILRVRPKFDNLSTFMGGGGGFVVKVDVVSVSGVQKSWAYHGLFSKGQSTTSLDGWITIDGCPYSDKHSIGVSITGTAGIDAPPPYVANFVGIDIDWLPAPTRSI